MSQDRASLWQRWFRQPQKVWLRRALFQVHLWLGLAIGAYVVVLSLSGSVLVYRLDLDRALSTSLPEYQPDRSTLTSDQIRAAAARRYPGHSITFVSERVTRRAPAFGVTVKRDDEVLERYFDPYTAADLGPTFTDGQRAVFRLVDLHDDLLLGRQGRWWNGVFGGVFTILVVTGTIVWWPGVARWKRSLVVRLNTRWQRLTWDLHSALGIWLCLFMLMWGVSGVYLGIPAPFHALVDRFSDPDALARPGDDFLAWLSQMHFGRFRGNRYASYLKATWAIVGIVPAVLFLSGVTMWWNRLGGGTPTATDKPQKAA